MKRSDYQRLERIVEYCKQIDCTIERYGKDFATFEKDFDYYQSVSMSLMQIGELSIGVSPGFKELTKGNINWKLLRDSRNMFAHSYERMRTQFVWKAATNDMPVLQTECEHILDELLNEKQANAPSIMEQISAFQKEQREKASNIQPKPIKKHDPER